MVMFRTVLETANDTKWVLGINRNPANTGGGPSRRGQCKAVLTPIALLKSLSNDWSGGSQLPISFSVRGEGKCEMSLFTAVLVPLESPSLEPIYVLWVDVHQV